MFATVSEWARPVRTAPHTHQAVPDVPMSQCGRDGSSHERDEPVGRSRGKHGLTGHSSKPGRERVIGFGPYALRPQDLAWTPPIWTTSRVAGRRRKLLAVGSSRRFALQGQLDWTDVGQSEARGPAGCEDVGAAVQHMARRERASASRIWSLAGDNSQQRRMPWPPVSRSQAHSAED